MTISVCILAKNESKNITKTINSVKDHVQEVIVIDDSSTDNTAELAKACGAKVISFPYEISKVGFDGALNFCISQATKEWVLWIDGDELLDNPEKLIELTRFSNKEAWALPRRKWENFKEKKREELEAYPDWQVRFFKRLPKNKFIGSMHVRFFGSPVFYAFKGPHIEHLQSELRDDFKIKQREILYENLANKQNVFIQGGMIKPLSEKK